MKRLVVSSLAGLGLLAASAAVAQEKTQEQAAEQEAAGQQAKQQQQAEQQQQRPTKQEMEEAGKAADTMVLRAYVRPDRAEDARGDCGTAAQPRVHKHP